MHLLFLVKRLSKWLKKYSSTAIIAKVVVYFKNNMVKATSFGKNNQKLNTKVMDL